ncbi:MAG TPA: FAD-binding protein [Acidobacteriota bacterium]
MALYDDLRRKLQGDLLTDDDSLKERSRDFGNMIERKPAAVVRPQGPQDLAATVRFARAHGLSVHSRGAAHTQSGQALSDGGLVIDSTGMDKVLAIDEQQRTIRVQSGLRWRGVVEAAKSHRLIPPVLTNNNNVTVGGTVSMAGIGVASYRHGVQADNVEELTVVLGSGDIVTCSRTENTEVFDAVRSTLGQFGLIAEAKLRLRPHQPNVRMYFLLYDSQRAYMDDAKLLMEEGRFDFIESFCAPVPMGFRSVDGEIRGFGRWFFPVHFTVEFSPGKEPDDNKLLAGLHHYQHVYTEDRPIHAFLYRMDRLFELWRLSGYWAGAHPWMETMLPYETAADYMDLVLDRFPPQGLMGGGHVLFWAARRKASSVPLFITPESEHIVGFGILPGLPDWALEQALPNLHLASDLSLQMGAKRYLSGLINFNSVEDWRGHYGDQWETMLRYKRSYDPDGVLNPGFIQYQ